MTQPQDYVLGVHDAEIARLGLQHRAWRARGLDLWRNAGIRAGWRVLDFGCGPGYASLDLAELTGPGGQVTSLDRSDAFLQRLSTERDRRGMGWIKPVQGDVSVPDLALGRHDLVWARWIFAFVPDLEVALDNFVGALAPGGMAAVQEYIEYAAWRMLPQEPAIERFCAHVMQSWRARGGEPNVLGQVIAGLAKRGLDIVSVEPALDVVSASDPLWDWPDSFVRGNVPRLLELGDLSAAEGAEIIASLDRAKARPETRMVTPLTGLLLARKPA